MHKRHLGLYLLFFITASLSLWADFDLSRPNTLNMDVARRKLSEMGDAYYWVTFHTNTADFGWRRNRGEERQDTVANPDIPDSLPLYPDVNVLMTNWNNLDSMEVYVVPTRSCRNCRYTSTLRLMMDDASQGRSIVRSISPLPASANYNPMQPVVFRVHRSDIEAIYDDLNGSGSRSANQSYRLKCMLQTQETTGQESPGLTTYRFAAVIQPNHTTNELIHAQRPWSGDFE